MIIVDTHTHLYDQRFDEDMDEVIRRAVESGVRYMLLPAVDSESHSKLIDIARAYPENCFAMAGFHPTSANDNPSYRKELEIVQNLLENPPVKFYAVGETGLDMYWSKDFLPEQTEALKFQIELALKYSLPIVLHTRDSFDEIIPVLKEYNGSGLKGVFHSFSGNAGHYETIRSLGEFKFGISGPLTYKKSTLPEVVANMDIRDILLETDSPYLPPVPFRGKRNESSYITYIAEKVAEIKGMPLQDVASITTANARDMFGLP